MASRESRVRRRARWILMAGALSTAQACGGAPPPAPAPVVSSRRAQPVAQADRLYRDDRAELGLERVVITNVDDLREWWDRSTAAAGDSRPPMPDIGFQTHMVLLVSSGASNAGDQIRVDSVGFEIQPSPSGGSTTVSFAVVSTIPDCNPFPGASYPMEMVRMPRANPDIDWIEIRTEC